ncbi:hypothetical protein Syun_025804 [Stephania yunnanensis]|uniref:K+ potassium transporter integral membrane domain-containing protein n=1 Tax=Stephania yunnanensis TaxID=152371 RepID=A0AAP0HVL7_9MAGN
MWRVSDPNVCGLVSLGRKKRRYADPGSSTSQMPDMVPHAEFDIVAEQLRKVMAFMHHQFKMTMDGAGLSHPPPPPPHDQQQPPQTDPADPPQQGDNVEREMQEWLTRDKQLGLFSIQSFGTCKVGFLFAPVLALWFFGLGTIGIYNIIKYDWTILRAFNPAYIYFFSKRME